MSPSCQFYNNVSHKHRPNYTVATLNHLILKSSLYLWCYNIPLLNQFWKRNWFNQYFHLPFIKCWNIPSFLHFYSPYSLNKKAYLKITLPINFMRLTSTRFTLYVYLCTTFFVSQIRTMSLSFLCLLS